MNQINLLALCGSLRNRSYNRASLEALKILAPPHIQINVFEAMTDLPLFNPDKEDEYIPAVHTLKQALSRSDGLIIATPEYAHGISGVMKNALDWLVSGNEFINIKIALVNTSPRASHAQNALREVIKTMSGDIVEPACVSIPLLGSVYKSNEIAAEPKLSETLNQMLLAFEHEIKNTETQRFG